MKSMPSKNNDKSPLGVNLDLVAVQWAPAASTKEDSHDDDAS